MKKLIQKLRAMLDDFEEISITTHASSIAYYTFLSLVPLLSICISLLSAIGISKEAAVLLLEALAPDALKEAVDMLIADAFERSGLAFSLSTVTLLWSASQGARALRVGLNVAYAQKETKGAIGVTVTSVLAGLIMDILLAFTLYLVFIGTISDALSGVIPALRERDTLMSVLNALATMAIATVWLAACYTYLPAGKRRFAAQLPGAVCGSMASAVMALGFRVYVDNFCNFTMLYGSLATIVLLLFWIFLVSMVCIACAFINRLFANDRMANLTPAKEG